MRTPYRGYIEIEGISLSACLTLFLSLPLLSLLLLTYHIHLSTRYILHCTVPNNFVFILEFASIYSLFLSLSLRASLSILCRSLNISVSQYFPISFFISRLIYLCVSFCLSLFLNVALGLCLSLFAFFLYFPLSLHDFSLSLSLIVCLNRSLLHTLSLIPLFLTLYILAEKCIRVSFISCEYIRSVV